MEKDYQRHITSTDENITFLHRCFRDCLNIVLKEGLSSWSGDLSGTATMQPQDIQEAEGLYRNGKDYGDTVVVVQFPRVLYQKKRRIGGDILDRELAYFHPIRKAFTVRPKFVTAWINRETDEVHPNPYSNREPIQGHERFDFMFG